MVCVFRGILDTLHTFDAASILLISGSCGVSGNPVEAFSSGFPCPSIDCGGLDSSRFSLRVCAWQFSIRKDFSSQFQTPFPSIRLQHHQQHSPQLLCNRPFEWRAVYRVENSSYCNNTSASRHLKSHSCATATVCSFQGFECFDYSFV